MSPHIRSLLSEIAQLDRRIASGARADPTDERSLIEMEKRREALTAELALLPLTQDADLLGKLSILCIRLRNGLHPRAADHVLTYMLAEAVRTDLARRG